MRLDSKSLNELTCRQQRWAIRNESGTPDDVGRVDLRYPVWFKVVIVLSVLVSLVATGAAIYLWRI